MNGTISLQHSLLNSLSYQISIFPYGLKNLSIISNQQSTKIIDDYLSDEYSALEKKIGTQLFQQADYEDKMYMINIFNSVDFGKAIDTDKLSEILKYDN